MSKRVPSIPLGAVCTEYQLWDLPENKWYLVAKYLPEHGHSPCWVTQMTGYGIDKILSKTTREYDADWWKGSADAQASGELKMIEQMLRNAGGQVIGKKGG